jgi:hypothetical protein
MQAISIHYLYTEKNTVHKSYRGNTNTLFHLAIFHFHNGFPVDGTAIYDTVLTANKGPTYNGWFNIWQGYHPVCLNS